MLLLRLAVRGLGLLSLGTVARLVPREDIGIAALAAAVILGVDVLQNMGMGVALLRKRFPSRDDYDTVWTLGLMRGSVKTVLVFVLAPSVAAWLGEPRLGDVLRVLALSSLLLSLSNTGVVQLERQLAYPRIFAMGLAAKLVYFVAVMAAAWLLGSYWALVIGIVAEQLAQCVLSYLMHDYRPRLRWQPDRELFAFSFWYWLNGVAGYLGRNGDVLIISRLLGMEAVGLYNLSQRISALASTEISAPIARAFRPGLAQVVGDHARLRMVYLRGLGGVILLGAPAATFLVCVTEPTVTLLFGERWLDAAPVVRILAVAGLLRMVTVQNQELLFLAHRHRLATGQTLVRVALLLPAVIVGAMTWGTVGAAVAVAAALLIQIAAGQMAVARRLEISMAEALRAVWQPLVAAGASGAALLTVQTWVAMQGALAAVPVQVVLLATLGSAVYVSALTAIWLAAGKPDGVVRELVSRSARLRSPALWHRGARSTQVSSER